MKILLVTFEFPPLIAGAGIYARELAVGLSYLGNEVSVLTCKHGLIKWNIQIDEELQSKYNIEVIRFVSSGKNYYIKNHFMLKRFFGKSFENNFDFIFLVDARATKYAELFLDNAKLAKCIHIFHGSENRYLLKKPNTLNRLALLSGRTKYVMNKSMAIITVSRYLKEQWESKYPFLNGKIHHVLNGIDENIFFPLSPDKVKSLRKKLDISNEDFVIISASRLIKEKGQDLLLESIPGLLKRINRLRVFIIGDGQDKSYLEQISKDLQIEKFVTFLGPLERESLANYIGLSDLFVLPSRIPYEGFGLVYIEANACGIPVISGNTGGVPDAVENMKSGLVVNPQNKDELLNALIKMLDEEFRKNLGKKAFKRVKQSFTNKKMAENILRHVQN